MISEAFAERLAREDLTLCRLVKIELPDNTVVFATDFSEDAVYQGDTYRSEPGISVSSIRRSIASAASSATIRVAYSPTGLKERTVRYGGADNAYCTVTLIDYLRPDIVGSVLIAGNIRRAELNDKFTCDLDIEQDGASNENVTIGEVYSQRCRNVFGDFRCKVNVEALQQEFTTTLVYAGNASFRIDTGLQTGAPPGDKPEEFTTGTITYSVPGDYIFEIPYTGTVTVEMFTSGGGAGSTCEETTIAGSVFPFADNGPIGGFGNASSFNGWILQGGEFGLGGIYGDYASAAGGGFVYRPDNRGLAYNLRKPSPPPLPDLDTLLVGPNAFAEIEEGGGGFGGRPGSLFGLANTEGGEGGPGHRGVIRFVAGTDGKPSIGQAIAVHLGAGGYGGVGLNGPSPFPVDVPTSYRSVNGGPGDNGFIRISWSATGAITQETQTEFNLGTIVWTKGLNAGLECQVASNSDGRIYLSISAAYPIAIGDEGYFQPGCTNYADVCENRWNNLINMQAEPAVPQNVSSQPTPAAVIPVDTTAPPPIYPDGYLSYTGEAGGGS